MPQIGEIKRAKDLGIKDSHNYQWLPCENCGRLRWVSLKRGIPRSKACPVCGPRNAGFQKGHKEPKGSESHNWKGGTKVSGEYITVYHPEHSRANKAGYVRRSILVIEQAGGLVPATGYHVHHLNGIKTDDRSENLAILTVHEHRKLHTRGGFIKNKRAETSTAIV